MPMHRKPAGCVVYTVPADGTLVTFVVLFSTIQGPQIECNPSAQVCASTACFGFVSEISHEQLFTAACLILRAVMGE